ncbi:TBCC domain-containing protein 1-like [Phalaenopsis equestris]|uniref:TBCC domain-containing protein 1-like n=1 Tax=Phalaenopsis equestris TaxID=78828 RepID=UPI0009E51965|nr:TBCC domain-containing protein 1-like [Phalaenopsis equestris]
MPSQADEEAHQLSYLQKHMANLIALLADSAEGLDDESLVITMERFEHLGFLIQFEKGCDVIPLRQAAPFFSNSDSDMPAAPVSAAQVHDWISQIINDSLEHNAEKAMAKENGPSSALDVDVTMADATPCHFRNQTSNSKTGISMQSYPGNSRTQTFVEGISKASLVKQPCDIKGHSVKILNCHDSVIYLLAPMKYAIVNGCSDATLVLGAIGKDVRVEHCERVQLIAAAKRICIANCRECIFYLGVNQRPLFLGDNHKLQVAPFNTYYPQLEEHLAYAGVDAAINKWDEPVVLGMVDPHDSLSHPAGVSDVQAESAAYLDPEQFTNFWIPNWFGDLPSHLTRCNPFPLPEIYMASQRNKVLLLADIQKALRDLQIDEDRRRELASALHTHFKDWLYGNVSLFSTLAHICKILL